VSTKRECVRLCVVLAGHRCGTQSHVIDHNSQGIDFSIWVVERKQRKVFLYYTPGVTEAYVCVCVVLAA